MTVQIIARWRREKNGRAGQVFRLTPTTGGNALQYLAIASLVRLQRGSVVGAHVARRNRIDVDTVFGPLIRERFRQLRDSAFRRGVSGDGDAALKREQRSDVDDLTAVSAFEHMPAGELRKPKDAREVDLNDCGPILFREDGGRRAADRPGVVDEDV